MQSTFFFLKSDSDKFTHKLMAKRSAFRKVFMKNKALKANGNTKTIKISKKELRTHLRNRLNRTLKVEDGQKESNPTINSSFLKSIQVHDLTCSICMHLFLMPFTLRCGHIFCFHCLDTLSQHESVCDSCPCCRASIGDNYPSRNRIVENILPYIVKQKLTSEERSHYTSRKQKMLEEFQRRAQENKTIAVNQKIDFKVGNHWQVGTVLKIYQKESKIKIEVQSAYSQIIYVFSSSSTHLAPFATFSKKYALDIEDYLDLDLSPLSMDNFNFERMGQAGQMQSASLNNLVTSFQEAQSLQLLTVWTTNDNL